MLSHPLVIEAAETLFTPVVVHNNTSGDDDARWRKHFNEPAWNYPVVRILDHDKKDLVNRISRDYTVEGLVRGMIEALERAKKDVPEWLRLLAVEEKSRRSGTLERVAFGMG